MTSLFGFSYDEAFSRNLGWVAAEEQARLKTSRVCIAGLGGVGGFLAGGDLHLDGLDFFALAIRREVFARCERLRIPAVTKLLLGRGPVIAAPRGLHLDAFRNRLAHTWRPGGNHHPLQRLLLRLGRRRLKPRHAQACP